MYALVLTFDKYKLFAQHMIMCYEKQWPDNPFTFRVPYQSEDIRDEYEKKFGDKVEMIKSPSGIVDTMFTLSDDLSKDEWVYWCMDDRYPITLKLVDIKKCYDVTRLNIGDGISGLMFCNNLKMWNVNQRYGKKENFTYCNLTFIRRKNYTMIWSHQFLRVSVIRTLFNMFPRIMKQAKEMDSIKDKAVLPIDQKLYFLDYNAAIFGESTNRGVVTKNCFESFKTYGLEIPKGFKISEQELIKGTNTWLDNHVYMLKCYIKHLINKK